MDRAEFTQKLILTSESLGYQASYNNGYERYLLFRAGSMHRVLIDQYEKHLQIYLFIRFGSMDYDIEGQPSDLVEILSLLLASYLRILDLKISASLLDVEHPMGQGIDGVIASGELYARLVSFSQPYNDGLFEYSLKSLEDLGNLFICIKSFEDCLSDILGSYIGQEGYSYDSEELCDFVKFCESALPNLLDPDNLFFEERINPDWLYYSRVDLGVAVVKSNFICRSFKFLAKDFALNEIESANYLFLRDSTVFNAFQKDDINIAFELLSSANEKISLIVPLENKIIVFGENIFVSISLSAGVSRYIEAKNIVLEKRKLENERIFGGKIYNWSIKIDAARFEDMVRAILYRSPGTITVRATSITNEPDEGVDIVWDCYAPVLSDMSYSEGEPLRNRSKILVQCKAWNSKSVGKSDIPDIRDMLDYHDAVGMLVVVSSNYASSLFKFAKKLRQNGIWFDIWDRNELEHQLDKYPDILIKYSDIVQVS